MTDKPKIGAHVSVAGGLEKAIENAKNIGAECIQIFGSSPRQWRTKKPTKDEVEKYKEAQKKSGIGPVYLHGAYLVNSASPSAETRRKSIKNLTEHFEIAEMIGAEGLIFHIGSGGKDMPKDKAAKLAVEGIKQVLKNVPGKSWLVLENAAGGGQKLGYDAKEMGKMLKMIKSKRVKICFDTAHAFEAGIIEEYSPKKIKENFDEWDREVGMENIVALHVNDSKTDFNSRHDRHENIGEGYIGLGGFRNLMKEKRLHNKAWILEVPGFGEEGPDKDNIEILKKMRG